MNIGQLFVMLGISVNKTSFAEGLAQLVALKVAAEGAGIIELGKHMADMAIEAAQSGTHILALSKQLGVSTQTMQEWGYVAKQSGSNSNEFSVAISQMERNLRLFAEGKGSKEVQRTFREFGISQADAAKALRSPDGLNDVLFTIADRMKALGINAESASGITIIAGRRARGFAADMAQGSDAIRAQIEHFHELGGVVDEKSLINLKEFNNNINDIKVAFNGLFMTLVAELSPGFVKLLKDLTTWISENKVFIKEVLAEGFKFVSLGVWLLIKSIEVLGWMINGVMNGDVGATATFALLASTVLLLAALIATVLIPTIVTLGGAIFAAMLPLLPYTIILAAIIALVILVAAHWDDIVDAVADYFDGFGTWFMGLLRSLWDGAKLFGYAIKGIFTAIGDAVIAGFNTAVKFIADKIDWLMNKVAWIRNHIPGLGGGDGEDGIDTIVRGGVVVKGEPQDVPGAGTSGGRPAINVRAPNVPTGQTESDEATNGGTRGRVSVGTASRSNSVSIGPTTININGVKDAHEATEHIANATDNQMRHAAAALGGEVQ